MTELLGFMLAYGSVFAIGAAAIARIACGTGEAVPEPELPVAKVVRR